MRAVLLHAVAAAALQPKEVWQSIKQQASVAASSESLSALMRPYLEDAIGSHGSLAPATAALLTERLGGALDSEKLTLVLEDRLAPAESLLTRDLNAVVEGDPAAPDRSGGQPRDPLAAAASASPSRARWCCGSAK
mgnify:CR=1 FL=1